MPEDRGIEALEALVASEPETKPTAPTIDWQDMALRLRAEMDNYYKRQQYLAEERVAQEKANLLTGFLDVVDNLEQVLAHAEPGAPCRQGIKATYDVAVKLLRNENVEAIPAIGKPFDPGLHEAVATAPASPDQKAEMLIVDEVRRGYRIGERLLRPARVIVAKK
jgi:molecular chaperone GrpE